MSKERNLTLNEYVEEAVRQVGNIYSPSKEQLENFRDSFCAITIDSVLNHKTNATTGGLEYIAFTSASDSVTWNISQALHEAQMPTRLSEGRCLLSTLLPLTDDVLIEARTMKEERQERKVNIKGM